jgi:glycine cleavage system H protein
MSLVPAQLRYTAEHEWVQMVDDTTIRFGITDYAQAALGDIVFVTLPAANAELSANSPCGEVESTKSVSDIYAPVDGTISRVNDAVETSPETMNSDPYGNGWIAEVSVANAESAMNALLTAEQYSALTSA